jgi:hypothetical protein
MHRYPAAMGHEANGELASWVDVAHKHPWNSLLLGNGFSAHLWQRFCYTSLFTEACDAGYFDELDEQLFEVFDTENFELVLSALSTSITVGKTLGDRVDHLYERYESIQHVLGQAVRDVHPALEQVPYDVRELLRRALEAYRHIFSTSYDLLLYWCMGAGSDGIESFHGFKDYFWGSECSFDPDDVAIADGATRVLNLHGALHLVVSANGVTKKRTKGMFSLLDQIGELDPTDPQRRPLLISEGSADDKLLTIQDNDYLRFGLKRLRKVKEPMVVFGHSLSEQDAHLIDALNRRTERPIAVSILVDGTTDVRARQAEIRRVLSTDDLYYFDASTHPLGDPEYRIEDDPVAA